MSTKIVNGKCIEVLSDDDEPETFYNINTFGYNPGFFEPKPISPKTQSTDYKTFKSKFVFGKRDSILGKRKAEEAFDEERYGQIIPDDYFKNGVGHGVINEPNTNLKTDVNFYYPDPDFEFIPTPEQDEILKWIDKYRENKLKGMDISANFN